MIRSARPPRLGDSALLLQARRYGLVPAHQRDAHRLSVIDRSRSNHVVAIEVDGRAVAYAKQAGPASLVDGLDPVAAERRCLGALAGAGLVPALVATHQPQVLWTAAVPGVRLRPDALVGPGGADLAAAWGRTLARLHRARVRTTDPQAPRPWVLRPGFTAAHLGAPALGSALRSTLTTLRSDRGLAARVASLARTWQSTGWIHGDATAANAVVADGGARVWLVDLEAGGVGDPRWDLATAYDCVDYHGLRTGSAIQAVATALATAYRRAGGPAALDDDALAARAALTAVQAAATPTVAPHLVAQLAARAVGFATAVDVSVAA